MSEFKSWESLNAPQAVAIAAVIALMGASGSAWAVILGRWLRQQPACPPAPVERRTWSTGLTFVFGAVIVPLQVLALSQLAGQFLGIVKVSSRETFTLQLVQLSCAINAVQVLVLVGLTLLISPLRRSDFGLFTDVPDVLCGVFGFLASWLPVLLVNMAVGLAGWRAPEGKHPFFHLLDSQGSFTTVAWIVFSVVILAPLAEELIYRVILQGWLEQRLPPWAAIGISSALFAAVHASPGRPDALPLWPLAIVLGVVYYRRHSLPAVMLIHALFNGSMLALAILGGS